jgi:hypothetical protein
MKVFRVLFGLILIGLVCWTGYAIYEMTNWRNSLEPAEIFCSKDEKVLVIHKPNAFDWNQIEFAALSETKNLLDPLLSNLPSSCKVYVSKTRSLILLENTIDWTNESLIKYLSKSNLRYSWKDGDLKIEQFSTVRTKNKLLIFKYEEDVQGAEFKWSELDQNATASIVTFGKSAIDFVDIYSKNNNTIEFHTKNSKGIQGKLIDDLSIFQSYIPAKATEYIFYENTYLKSIDAEFRKGPIQSFVESGLVSFYFENQPIVMCQFKEGQNAVQNLNEFFQKKEDNTLVGKFDNLSISNKLRLAKGTYYVQTIDNIAFFASSQEVLDLILKEIELGKTWLYNDEDLSSYRQNLPKSVSYRSFTKLQNKSISVLGSKIVETQVKYKAEKLTLNTDLEYLSVSINGKIKDFESFIGKGNIVCLTEEGLILGIENGTKTWKKDMEDKPVGDMQVLKTKEKEYLVITGSKSIHVIDRYGKYLDGYPVKWTKSNLVVSSNAYLTKGQISVGAYSSAGTLILFNSAGKLSKELKINQIEGVENLDFFSVDSKLHVSLKSSDRVIIYNIEEKKMVKEIENCSFSILTDIPNSSFVSYSKAGKLTQLNYPNKDNEEVVTEIKADVITTVQSIDSIIYTISLFGNQAYISKNGREVIFEKDFANSRINSGDIFKNSFKETYFSVSDGMENGVYLYDEKGRMYVKGKIEGTKKVSLNQASGYSVTLATVVDGYIIQYLVK